MDIAGAMILLFLIASAGGYLAWWFWQRRQLRHAKRWPRTEATIESGAIEVFAQGRRGSISLPVFAFSYVVSGQYFSGRFALLLYIADPGPSIIERMVGRKLSVGYKPECPEVWFVPDDLIEGCKVEQKLGPHLMSLYPKD